MEIVELIKDHNIGKIIDSIRNNGPISRIELSKTLNIPQPTVTRLIDKLLNEEILLESGLGSSTTVGRRPILLDFNPESVYAIGIEIGRTIVRIALVNFRGRVVSSRKIETNNKGDFSNIIQFLKESYYKLLREFDIPISKILGVGVGVPGPLNETREGFITLYNFYNEASLPIKFVIEEALGLPVILDINANVAALAEKWFGLGKSSDDFVYVMADAGVGSGIVVNGGLHRGSHHESGMLGHTMVDINGEKCSCGNYGCLETLVSTIAITEKVKKILKQMPRQEESIWKKDIDQLVFGDIVRGMERGSEVAIQVVEGAGTYLGIGLTNLINLLDPKLIIIGGALIQLGDVFLEKVRETIKARAVGNGGKKTQIKTTLYSDSVVVGSAALVINERLSI